MEKVKVTKEVAEAIERQLSRRSRIDIVQSAAKTGVLTDDFARALYIGYEIEKSPENKVREYFDELVGCEEALELVGTSGAQFRQGWQSVKHTLDLLGIKIEGVNA